MPCYYTGSAEGDQALAANERAKEYSNTLTEVTELLCLLCEHIEEKHYFPPKVAAWWKEHKKIDAERLRRENEEAKIIRLRESALSKLEPDERKALGL